MDEHALLDPKKPISQTDYNEQDFKDQVQSLIALDPNTVRAGHTLSPNSLVCTWGLTYLRELTEYPNKPCALDRNILQVRSIKPSQPIATKAQKAKHKLKKRLGLKTGAGLAYTRERQDMTKAAKDVQAAASRNSDLFGAEAQAELPELRVCANLLSNLDREYSRAKLSLPQGEHFLDYLSGDIHSAGTITQDKAPLDYTPLIIKNLETSFQNLLEDNEIKFDEDKIQNIIQTKSQLFISKIEEINSTQLRALLIIRSPERQASDGSKGCEYCDAFGATPEQVGDTTQNGIRKRMLKDYKKGIQKYGQLIQVIPGGGVVKGIIKYRTQRELDICSSYKEQVENIIQNIILEIYKSLDTEGEHQEKFKKLFPHIIEAAPGSSAHANYNGYSIEEKEEEEESSIVSNPNADTDDTRAGIIAKRIRDVYKKEAFCKIWGLSAYAKLNSEYNIGENGKDKLQRVKSFIQERNRQKSMRSQGCFSFLYCCLWRSSRSASDAAMDSPAWHESNNNDDTASNLRTPLIRDNR